MSTKPSVSARSGRAGLCQVFLHELGGHRGILRPHRTSTLEGVGEDPAKNVFVTAPMPGSGEPQDFTFVPTWIHSSRAFPYVNRPTLRSPTSVSAPKAPQGDGERHLVLEVKGVPSCELMDALEPVPDCVHV